jgi:hypothetical protein
MTDRIKAGVMGLATIAIFAFAALIPVPQASAGQTGSFTGSWVASGKHQPFDFVEGPL